jgi:hypothetical protein
VIASQDGIGKNHPQFWTALDQKLKPSLNYIVTLAMSLDAPESVATPHASVAIRAGQPGLAIPPTPEVPVTGPVFSIIEDQS